MNNGCFSGIHPKCIKLIILSYKKSTQRGLSLCAFFWLNILTIDKETVFLSKFSKVDSSNYIDEIKGNCSYLKVIKTNFS